MRSFPNLQTLLADLEKPIDPIHTFLVAHYPPYESGLDKSAFNKPIGSKALYDFLMSSNNALACHGHVHEAPYLTGHWVKTVGKTLCMNPGQWGEQLHAILFDTDDVLSTIRHTLFGHMDERKVPRFSSRLMRRELKRKWRAADVLNESAYKHPIRKLLCNLGKIKK